MLQSVEENMSEKIRTHAHRSVRPLFVIAPVALGLLLAGTVSQAARPAGFTQMQSAHGAAVYTAHCEVCHGTNLGGQSGPPLMGTKFTTSYEKNRPVSTLYDFIAKQMPYNAPGSLSQKDYLDVTAYVLAKNGYPAGNAALTSATLGEQLSPPKNANVTEMGAPGAGISAEIIRTAPATNTVYSALPAGADVAITDTMMNGASTDNSDWLLNGRSYDNQRYSPLTQIDTTNVKSLMPAALVQTGMTASFETTPVVVNGVMYITTPVVDSKMKVMALNAVTGENIWTSTYNLGSFKICCGPVNRGVAVAYGKVYVVTLDDKLLALDATTGKQVWSSTVAKASLGYSETMAPVAYDGKIVIGSAGGEWPIAGFVAAYDAQSGKQDWRWMSTDPKSFAGDSWKRGGGMVWTTPAIDPKLGLVVFATGNPNPDLFGAARKGDNLYTDSIVALDVNTGQLKWNYQEVKHDVWDYDAVSPVVLFDTVDDAGKPVAAAGEAGKVGWFFIVDRATGKLIRKSDPYVMFSQNMFSQPTKAGVDMLPGANGGSEWSPPAYSPDTHFVYVLAMDQLMKFTTQEPAHVPGQIRLGSAFANIEKHGVQDGPFVAINVDTGKVAWQYMAPQPLMGGALATAGNLVFMGEGNGWFDAFNAKTGDKLWRFNLGAGVNAPPITYQVNGEQYIAVAAGGNFQMTYPYGDTLAIFKLTAPKVGVTAPKMSAETK
jgi:alcohol dehydrogenase (cytochrome c)